MSALRKCLRLIKKDRMKKVTFYVIRLSATGKLRDSAPCQDCVNKLNNYNIKRFIFSTNDETCVSIRQRDYTTNFITRCKLDSISCS